MEALPRWSQCHFSFRAMLSGLLFLLLLAPRAGRADGSKDLIKNGGYRPFLEAGNNRFTAGINRLNKFYVYARAGETLQLGSSAMGIYEGDILFTRPNGTAGSCLAIKPANASEHWGRIRGASEEAAGPLPNTGGFSACELAVEASTEGIWEVVFIGPAPDSWKYADALPAGTEWVQASDVYTVAAWDLTVRNAQGTMPGRVFAKHLPLVMGDIDAPLASELFVLTEDGYQYRIDFKDASGHTMLLFSNDSGFQDANTLAPFYRSVVTDELNTANNTLPENVYLHSPAADDGDASTHKIFFALPSTDLPAAAMHGAQPVWLLNNPIAPAQVSSLSYTGSAGKTGSFSFFASEAGRFQVAIDLNKNGIWGDEGDVTLNGNAQSGDNTVPWNGLDAEGLPVVGTEGGYNARVVALAGEMHLPLLDLEDNAQGFTIERINGEASPDYTVYFNDTAIRDRAGSPDVVIGSGGQDSRRGVHAFSNSFGDDAGVDTWAYAASTPAYVATPLFQLVSDLRLSIDVETQTPASNQLSTVTLRLANDGPDDASNLRVRVLVPAEISIQNSSTDNGSFEETERTWHIDQVANGTEASLVLTFTASEKGSYALLGEIIAHAGEDPDSDPGNHDDRFGDRQEDDTDQALIYVDAEPSVGIAEHLASVSGDLTGFVAEFELLVENLGNTPLSDIQVTNNLLGRFQGTDFQVVDIKAYAPLVANPSFDGDLDVNLLNGTQSRLEIGEQSKISLTVSVNPFGNLGPYSGNAVVYAEGFDGERVEDVSDSGLVTDANLDGVANGAGEDDPTIVALAHNPAIGLAMEVTNVSGSPSDFTADYRLVVKNLGNVPLSDVQIVNDLGGSFGPGNTTVTGLSATGPLVTNSGFNGQQDDNMLNAASSSLAAGEQATLSFSLQASPSFNLGFFNQVARATALAPGDVEVFDLSDEGQEPDANGNGRPDDPGEDDVTVIAFEEHPAIGASLFTTSVAGDLGGFTIHYDLDLKNLGDGPLYGIQALEDLESVFEGTSFTVSDMTATQPLEINPGFDGINDKNLLVFNDGFLATQGSASISFKVNVVPESNFGPYKNSVMVYGNSQGGATTSDASDSGMVIDPDNDGKANEVGENDPTVTAFAPTGHLGTSLGITSISGDLNAFNAVYTVVVENLGDVALSSVVLTQDLETVLAGAQYEVIRVTALPPFEANPLFDGAGFKSLLSASSASLGVGEQTQVDIELAITPIDDFGPYALSNTVAALTPFGTSLFDESTDGLNPDPNHNNNPTEAGENEPTVLSIQERPVIGVSMAATSLQGDLKEFTTRYVIRLENLGDVPLDAIQVTSDFASSFDGTAFEVIQITSKGALSLNAAFDGRNQLDLIADTEPFLPGDTARIEVDVRVVPVSNFGPYTHSVLANASGPNGTSTSDISNDGFETDVNGNGIPNEASENQPTLLSLNAQPAIGLAKLLSIFEERSAGFEASFDLTVRNTGDVSVTGVQVVEDFADAFPGASVELLEVKLQGQSGFALNPGFDGFLDTNLLSLNSTNLAKELAPGEDILISYRLSVTPAGGTASFFTQAEVKALDPSGNPLTDLSNEGINPDPNGNGIASDEGEDRPTIVKTSRNASMLLHPAIEAITGDTTKFQVVLSFALENDGESTLDSLNLDIDLAGIFPGADMEIREVMPAQAYDWSVNPAYDGESEIALFDDRGITLPPAHSGRVKVTLDVTPASDTGPYKGFIEASAVTLQGLPVSAKGFVPPVRIATSTGEEAGLESNGDLASLVSTYTYKKQRASWMQAPAKQGEPPLFSIAGAAAVDGAGSLNNQEVLDLVPDEGPELSEAIVTTPLELYGITNATSVLAVDYVARGERLAAVFATTSAFDELYDHTKNICDRLKGASLESVDLISIKGHPFVLSVLEHENGEVDYAISFVGYRNGINYLVDSRFVRDAYKTQIGVTGEILNFQVWSYNPEYTISVVEEIVSRMEEVGGVDFVSREDDIPEIPEMFVEQGSYRAGQLEFRLRKPAGASEFRFQGEVSSTEGGERSVFERVVPISNTTEDEGEVVVVLPSGQLFDAQLTVSNDVNENIDQIYVADGPWGKVEDGEEDTDISMFDILEQGAYAQSDGEYVIERGVALQGVVARNLVLFRHFRPGGRSVDLSDFSYISFTASGSGTAQLRLEESGETEDFFTKDIELKTTPANYTIFFDEFSKRDGQSGFKGFATTALSFTFDSGAAGPMDVGLRVENLVFGSGQPTSADDNGLIPVVYSLSQNYPNPFNPSTTIQFGLPEPADVLLEVFDMLGRKVMTVAQQEYPAGRYEVSVDASRLASGSYLYRLIANDKVFTRAMHLVK